MKTQASCAFLLSLTLVASCGGGGAISSGLPQTRPVNELTRAELDQLCESIDDYLFSIYPVTEEHRVSCTATALARTVTSAQCQDDVRTCMMEAFPGREHIDCMSATTAGCTATVDQIETCIEDRARSIDQRTGEVQCSAAGNSTEIGRLATPLELPPTCTSLSATCRAEIGI